MKRDEKKRRGGEGRGGKGEKVKTIFQKSSYLAKNKQREREGKRGARREKITGGGYK